MPRVWMKVPNMERWEINRLFTDIWGINSSHAKHFLLYYKDIAERFRDNPIFDKALFVDGEFLTPFDEALLEIRMEDDVTLLVKITNDKSQLLIFAVIDALGKQLTIESVFLSNGKYDFQVGGWDGRTIRRAPDNQHQHPYLYWGESLSRHIQAFLVMCNHPHHSIVQRFPKEKKNDVNWVASRSHYLIIDNDESKTISHSGVSRSFDGTITRAMHARRAHFRTLRHERFKTNVGKKVWVHSCWVGPKNGKGRMQKSIV